MVISLNALVPMHTQLSRPLDTWLFGDVVPDLCWNKRVCSTCFGMELKEGIFDFKR